MGSQLRTVDYDRLASSAPLNKAAAADYSATGEAFEPKTIEWRWDTPPPMRPIPPDAPSLLGLRVGRLRVVGLLDAEPKRREMGLSKPAKGARWVVRCDCGAYEARKSKTLTDPKNIPRLMCSHCDYVSQLVGGQKVTKTVAERIAEAREKTLSKT